MVSDFKLIEYLSLVIVANLIRRISFWFFTSLNERKLGVFYGNAVVGWMKGNLFTGLINGCLTKYAVF